MFSSDSMERHKKFFYLSLPLVLLYSGFDWECELKPELAEVVISPETVPWAMWDTADLSILREGNRLYGWIDANTGPGYEIGMLYSDDDGQTWVDPYGKPLLSRELSWETVQIVSPHVLKRDGRYEMWYSGTSDGRLAVGYQIGLATSRDGLTWMRETSPVLPFGASGSEDDFSVVDPCVRYEDGEYRMWYSGAEEVKGLPWFQVWEASSKDGLTWTDRKPIVSDWILSAAPEVIEHGGTRHLFYVTATSPGKAAFQELRHRSEGWLLGFGFSHWKGETLLSHEQLGPVAAHSLYSPCVDLNPDGTGWLYLSAHDHLGVWRVVRMPMTLSRSWFGLF
ncbi:MAG: hypothetical protein KC994_10300 [Candidatus Omnitrophica bacterium]|nr:hypothetical protein [Candidatus Omnitrophota bacterium]